MKNKVKLNLELEVSDDVYKLIWNESAMDIKNKALHNLGALIHNLEIEKTAMCISGIKTIREENEAQEMTIDIKQAKLYVVPQH